MSAKAKPDPKPRWGPVHGFDERLHAYRRLSEGLLQARGAGEDLAQAVGEVADVDAVGEGSVGRFQAFASVRVVTVTLKVQPRNPTT